MKVAFLIPSFEGGGTERVIITLANGFAKRGIDVFIISLNSKGAYQNEVNENVKIEILNTKRTIFSFIKIKNFLDKENPNILFSSIAHLNIFIIIVKRIMVKSDRKFVIRESNTLSEIMKSNNNLKNIILCKLIRIFYPKADLIVSPSQGVADDLMKNYGIDKNKIKVIYNPIDHKFLLNMAKEPVDNYFINNKSPEKVIIGIGSLTKQKNFSSLIMAFYNIKRHHNYKLIILGEGKERSKLESLIERLNIRDCILMPGFVKNPFKYLINANVFVLSSIYEGLPNVLIQALLLGVPCVSTKCKSGPEEILNFGEYGQLVRINDHVEMSDAILNVLEGRLKQKNINGLEKKYNINKIINNYLESPVFNKYNLLNKGILDHQ